MEQKPSSVDLKKTKLGAEETKELAEALKTNMNLKFIQPFYSELQMYDLFKLGIIDKFKAMIKGRFLLNSVDDLKSLPDYVQISFKTKKILKILRMQLKIVVWFDVDLSDARFGDEGMKALAVVLKENTTLIS